MSAAKPPKPQQIIPVARIDHAAVTRRHGRHGRQLPAPTANVPHAHSVAGHAVLQQHSTSSTHNGSPKQEKGKTATTVTAADQGEKSAYLSFNDEAVIVQRLLSTREYGNIHQRTDHANAAAWFAVPPPHRDSALSRISNSHHASAANQRSRVQQPLGASSGPVTDRHGQALEDASLLQGLLYKVHHDEDGRTVVESSSDGAGDSASSESPSSSRREGQRQRPRQRHQPHKDTRGTSDEDDELDELETMYEQECLDAARAAAAATEGNPGHPLSDHVLGGHAAVLHIGRAVGASVKSQRVHLPAIMSASKGGEKRSDRERDSYTGAACVRIAAMKMAGTSREATGWKTRRALVSNDHSEEDGEQLNCRYARKNEYSIVEYRQDEFEYGRTMSLLAFTETLKRNFDKKRKTHSMRKRQSVITVSPPIASHRVDWNRSTISSSAAPMTQLSDDPEKAVSQRGSDYVMDENISVKGIVRRFPPAVADESSQEERNNQLRRREHRRLLLQRNVLRRKRKQKERQERRRVQRANHDAKEKHKEIQQTRTSVSQLSGRVSRATSRAASVRRRTATASSVTSGSGSEHVKEGGVESWMVVELEDKADVERLANIIWRRLGRGAIVVKRVYEDYKAASDNIRKVWVSNESLCVRFVEKMYSTCNNVHRALVLCDDFLAKDLHKQSQYLRYWRVKLLAEQRNVSVAWKEVTELLGEQFSDSMLKGHVTRVSALLGKMRYAASSNSLPERRQLASVSAFAYMKAYELTHDLRDAVNAATMHRASGDKLLSSKIALMVASKAKDSLMGQLDEEEKKPPEQNASLRKGGNVGPGDANSSIGDKNYSTDVGSAKRTHSVSKQKSHSHYAADVKGSDAGHLEVGNETMARVGDENHSRAATHASSVERNKSVAEQKGCSFDATDGNSSDARESDVESHRPPVLESDISRAELSQVLGEALVNLDKPKLASEWYGKAVTKMPRLKRMRSVGVNLSILVRADESNTLSTALDSVLESVTQGLIVCFAGQKLETPPHLDPSTVPPAQGLPNTYDALRAVSVAIERQVEKLAPSCGFCTLSCGPDIIFAEAMLARGAPVHVLLPFDLGDYMTSNIDYGLKTMGEWKRRAQSVLDRAEVLFVTKERFYGDMILFDFSMDVMKGLAMVKAKQSLSAKYQMPLVMSCMDIQRDVTYIRRFLLKWRLESRPCHIIDLRICLAKAGRSGNHKTSLDGKHGSSLDKLLLVEDFHRFHREYLVGAAISGPYANPKVYKTLSDTVYAQAKDMRVKAARHRSVMMKKKAQGKRKSSVKMRRRLAVTGVQAIDQAEAAAAAAAESDSTVKKSQGKGRSLLQAINRVASRKKNAAFERFATKLDRAVRFMVFVDIVQENLVETHVPTYFVTHFEAIARAMDKTKIIPMYMNTWGSGCYFVFTKVLRAAEFSMALLRSFKSVDWKKKGLPADTTTKIGIHGGPVFPGYNPVLRKHCFFGAHVVRAARIKAVVDPGNVWVSEQFLGALVTADNLTSEAGERRERYAWEFLGHRALAKGYDRCVVFKLSTHEEHEAEAAKLALKLSKANSDESTRQDKAKEKKLMHANRKAVSVTQKYSGEKHRKEGIVCEKLDAAAKMKLQRETDILRIERYRKQLMKLDAEICKQVGNTFSEGEKAAQKISMNMLARQAELEVRDALVGVKFGDFNEGKPTRTLDAKHDAAEPHVNAGDRMLRFGVLDDIVEEDGDNFGADMLKRVGKLTQIDEGSYMSMFSDSTDVPVDATPRGSHEHFRRTPRNHANESSMVAQIENRPGLSFLERISHIPRSVMGIKAASRRECGDLVNVYLTHDAINSEDDWGWSVNFRLVYALLDKLLSYAMSHSALRLVEKALQRDSNDLETIILLRYYRVLATQKGSNIERARLFMTDLLAVMERAHRVGAVTLSKMTRAKVYALAGSLLKHKFKDASVFQEVAVSEKVLLALKRNFASESAELYVKVFLLVGGSFPAVNASTMFFLAGNLDKAREYANIVIRCSAHELAMQAVIDRKHKTAYTEWETAMNGAKNELKRAQVALDQEKFVTLSTAESTVTERKEKLALEKATARVEQLDVEGKDLVAKESLVKEREYWLLVSIGESYLILGDALKSLVWYQRGLKQALSGAYRHFGHISSTYNNVKMMKASGKVEIPDVLMALFRRALGRVVYFASHAVVTLQAVQLKAMSLSKYMSDAEQDRLRVSMYGHVQEAIRIQLKHLKPSVAVCLLLSDTDLLFAEAALQYGAELHIVLPFDKYDLFLHFKRFDMMRMPNWSDRMDAVFDQAEVHYVATDRQVDNRMVIDFSRRVLKGIANVKALDLGSGAPVSLFILDDDAAKIEELGGSMHIRQDTLTANSSAGVYFTNIDRLYEPDMTDRLWAQMVTNEKRKQMTRLKESARSADVSNEKEMAKRRASRLSNNASSGLLPDSKEDIGKVGVDDVLKPAVHSAKMAKSRSHSSWTPTGSETPVGAGTPHSHRSLQLPAVGGVTPRDKSPSPQPSKGLIASRAREVRTPIRSSALHETGNLLQSYGLGAGASQRRGSVDSGTGVRVRQRRGSVDNGTGVRVRQRRGSVDSINVRQHVTASQRRLPVDSGTVTNARARKVSRQRATILSLARIVKIASFGVEKEDVKLYAKDFVVKPLWDKKKDENEGKQMQQRRMSIIQSLNGKSSLYDLGVGQHAPTPVMSRRQSKGTHTRAGSNASSDMSSTMQHQEDFSSRLMLYRKMSLIDRGKSKHRRTDSEATDTSMESSQISVDVATDDDMHSEASCGSGKAMSLSSNDAASNVGKESRASVGSIDAAAPAQQPKSCNAAQMDVHLSLGFTRVIRTLLFADVKGYSKLNDSMTPLFNTQFLGMVRDCIDANPAEFWNTWGDGLFLAFRTAKQGADFAVDLLERMQSVDWGALGLPPDSSIRIGMHCGPVFRGFDSIIGDYNYFGRHVSIPDQIEPITTPGSVWATEQFVAALLTSHETHDFTVKFVGSLILDQSDEWNMQYMRRHQDESKKSAMDAANDGASSSSATVADGRKGSTSSASSDVAAAVLVAPSSKDHSKFEKAVLREEQANASKYGAGTLSVSDKDLRELVTFRLYAIVRAGEDSLRLRGNPSSSGQNRSRNSDARGDSATPTSVGDRSRSSSVASLGIWAEIPTANPDTLAPPIAGRVSSERARSAHRREMKGAKASSSVGVAAAAAAPAVGVGKYALRSSAAGATEKAAGDVKQRVVKATDKIMSGSLGDEFKRFGELSETYMQRRAELREGKRQRKKRRDHKQREHRQSRRRVDRAAYETQQLLEAAPEIRLPSLMGVGVHAARPASARL